MRKPAAIRRIRRLDQIDLGIFGAQILAQPT
jgi:hypothetical protein